jgi:hypothetical protein
VRISCTVGPKILRWSKQRTCNLEFQQDPAIQSYMPSIRVLRSFCNFPNLERNILPFPASAQRFIQRSTAHQLDPCSRRCSVRRIQVGELRRSMAQRDNRHSVWVLDMHRTAAGPPGRCPVQPSTPLGPDQVNVLLLLALCHDSHHDGFVGQSNIQAQTSSRILFKNQSVLEMHYCTTSIDVSSQDACNIFASFCPSDSFATWNLVIHLILAINK